LIIARKDGKEKAPSLCFPRVPERVNFQSQRPFKQLFASQKQERRRV
jgi:hypothetical protein